MKPALLVSLPTGLTVGGVQVWAARLCSALAERGRIAGIIVHPEEGRPLDIPLHRDVRVFRVPDGVPLRSCRGDLGPSLPTYRGAVEELFATTGHPVVCIPQHLGDSAGLFAALTREMPDKLRIAGWCQLDSAYDLRVLDFYAPVLRHVAAVSDHLESTLRERLTTAQVWNIPNATPTGGGRPRRNTMRPRLIYLGRIDRDVKRVLALPVMSRELLRLGIAHELTITGDGPAAPELQQACCLLDHVTITPAATPAQVPAILDDHDLFVLPSRAEGLSLALLEALSRGCVPFVARTDSGATQVVTGDNGLVVDVPPFAGETAAGVAMARAIAANAHRLPRMSAAAIASIEGGRYSLSAQASAAEHLIDAAADGPPLVWPGDRNPSFTAQTAHGSGATPPGAEEVLRALLESVADRTLIVHGTGNHTLELLHVLDEHKAHIAAFTDDDPSRQGDSLLGLPVLSPLDACVTGATDVIISSWMHQDAIWSRRHTFERQGLAVHRMYPPAAVATAPTAVES